MSDLQVALIILGTCIIAGVLALNWWQERKYRRQMENSFSRVKSDALLDDPKINVEHLNIADDTPVTFSFTPPAHNDLGNTGADQPDMLPLNKDLATLDADASLLDAELAEVEALAVKTDQASANVRDHIQQKTHHEDIKNIINDVFSQSSKLPMSSSNPTQVKALNAALLPEQEIEQPTHEKVTQAASTPIEPVFEPQALTLAPMLDVQIDLIAVLFLANETVANTLEQQLLRLLDSYDKTVLIHVLDSHNDWHLFNETATRSLLSGVLTTKLSCSIQLADRAGAVSRNTLNRFQLAVETLGLDINAHVSWQTNGDILAAANALDAFCIEVDKTIGLTLTHGDTGPFTGTKLRGLAEAQGLTLATDGTFHYYDETQVQSDAVKVPTFIMFNADNYPFSPDMLRNAVVKSVGFQLDIPHVKNCTEVYNTMLQVAQQMRLGLHAGLMASNQKLLGEAQIEKTRQQLQVIHATMLTRGITPGSASALRLFS